jgi:hypothetical protein
MLRYSVAACLVLLPLPAAAAWQIETITKPSSTFDQVGGKIDTVAARAAHNKVFARLQLKCFVSPQLSGITFEVILSKAPPNGFMAHRYQYDDNPSVTTKAFSRTLPAEAISLGDITSTEVQGLARAKVMMLTLLPADGSELPYEFDVQGAANAMKSVGCKETNKLR